jgi:hypothetical protein
MTEYIYDHMHKRSTIEALKYSKNEEVISLCDQTSITKTDPVKGTPCPACSELYEQFLNAKY